MWVREDSQEQGPEDGLGFLVPSSLVLLFLKDYRKDVSEKWWSCLSLETKGGCNLTEEQGHYRLWCVWARGITVLSIFYSLSFLSLLFASCSTSCQRFHLPVSQVSLCLAGLTPTKLCWKMSPLPMAFGVEQLSVEGWMPLRCWGNLCTYRGIRTGRRSWTCLHSEHSVAARCNHNMLFSAVLKATLPYHLSEYYYYLKFCGMGVEHWEGSGICGDLGQGCLCSCFDFLF